MEGKGGARTESEGNSWEKEAGRVDKRKPGIKEKGRSKIKVKMMWGRERK